MCGRAHRPPRATAGGINREPASQRAAGTQVTRSGRRTTPAPCNAVSRARPAWLRALVSADPDAFPEHRRLIGNCLSLLLPRPLVRAPAAPSVWRPRWSGRVRRVLSFAPERDIVEDALPLVELPHSHGERVELAPHGERLDHGTATATSRCASRMRYADHDALRVERGRYTDPLFRRRWGRPPASIPAPDTGVPRGFRHRRWRVDSSRTDRRIHAPL